MAFRTRSTKVYRIETPERERRQLEEWMKLEKVAEIVKKIKARNKREVN